MSAGARGPVTRQEVNDPLAFNPLGSSPDRSVAVGGVSNPGKSAGTGNQANTEALLAALGNVQGAVAGIADQANDRAITEGKIAFEQGKTLEEVRAAGNQYNVQGYETLNAASSANKFYTDESIAIQKEAFKLTPDEYATRLRDSRKAAMGSLPDDPAVRKVYAAAFEEAGPRLASAHAKANSDYMEKQTNDAFVNLLGSTSTASAGATQRSSTGPITSLRISPEIVDKPQAGNARDRDIGIRTMLGEAGGEGEVGLAAVAHVLKNRAGDSRWGGSIAQVALAPKQFSAWNSKDAGGVDRVRTVKETDPAYIKAGLIYDAVTGGHTIDPTGGATHYYAPKGMPALVASGAAPSLTPSWAGKEAAKGTVTIGNHVFVGKAGLGGGNTPPGFVPAGRFGLGGATASYENQGAPAPSDGPTAAPRQAPAPIPPVTAETERQTQLLEGTLKPETQSDKDFLRTSGGATPGGVKNGVEINAQPGANPDAAAKTAGVEATQPRANSQVRELVLGFNGMKPEKKAVAVADAIRRQLAAGDDTLYNDLGGEAFLRDSLHAVPSDVDEVMKAKKAFDKENLNKFNSGAEKERAQLLADAKSGNFTEDQMTQRVQSMRGRNLMNDADAKTLTRDALEKVYSAKGDSQKLNLEYQDDIANLYSGVRGGMDPHHASEIAKALAVKHNVPVKELEGVVAKIYSEDESRHKALEAEARANAKTALDEKTVSDRVDAALTRGSGLNNITGKVTMPDKYTGADVKVSAAQVGVRRLEDQIKTDIEGRVKSGDLDKSLAGPTLEKIKFAALAKQGVVDEDFKNDLAGSLTGDIMDKKTGKPTSGAKAGFEMWLRLGNDPAVGSAYMNQYLTDENKTLVETAKTMYDGRLNTEDALIKATALLNDPLADPNARIAKDAQFQKEAGPGITKAIAEAIGTDSWVKYFMGTVGFNADDQQKILEDTGRMNSYVYTQANAYHMQNPNVPSKVAIKMAVDDAARNFIPSKGGMLYGNYEKGQRLDTVMGVEGYSKDTPSKIIDDAVRQYGPKKWGALWEEKAPGIIGNALNAVAGYTPFNVPGTDGFSSRRGASNTPPYSVQYAPDDNGGKIMIQLYDNYDDPKKRDLKGSVLILNAKSLGQNFVREDRKPSVAANVWDTVSRSVADTLYGNSPNATVKQGYSEAELADPIGFRERKKN